MSFYTYFKNRKSLDFKYIITILDNDDREYLEYLKLKYPNKTIRLPNSDLIAAGYISGIGGAVAYGAPYEDLCDSRPTSRAS